MAAKGAEGLLRQQLPAPVCGMVDDAKGERSGGSGIRVRVTLASTLAVRRESLLASSEILMLRMPRIWLFWGRVEGSCFATRNA